MKLVEIVMLEDGTAQLVLEADDGRRLTSPPGIFRFDGYSNDPDRPSLPRDENGYQTIPVRGGPVGNRDELDYETIAKGFSGLVVPTAGFEWPPGASVGEDDEEGER